jgi:ParB-like chromosome segregation protein Spo0J
MMTETTNKYQVMPHLSNEEYEALKEDIAQNGVSVPVVQDTDGNIIDGHHRVQAYQELLAEGRAAGGYPIVERGGITTDEKRDLAWSLNMQRRHLNQAQKRDAIERKLKESPEWADNRIAQLLGVDGKTVRFARVQLEGRKEIAKLKKLIGADGKAYPRVVLRNKLRDAGSKSRATLAELEAKAESGLVEAEEGGQELASTLEEMRNELSPDEYRAYAGQVSGRIERIVRAAAMEYVVEYGDGARHSVVRNVLLEQGWRKCPHCKGHGITTEGS